MTRGHTLAGSHIGVAVAAFGLAALMGMLQSLSIADVNFPGRSETLYYMAVTAHGVLAGTDASALPVQVMYIGTGASVVFLTFYRILIARTRPRPAEPATSR